MRTTNLVGTMLGFALTLTACGGTTGEGSTAPSTTSSPPIDTTTSSTIATTTTTPTPETTLEPAEASACDLVTPEMVEAAYGGDVERGIEGYADNCTYWIDGSELAVTKVDVFNRGPAEGWDDLVDKQIADWGGIIEVDGVGRAAFHPTYHKGRDLFFSTDDTIYSIVSFGGVEGENLDVVTEAVLSLAAAIIEHNG